MSGNSNHLRLIRTSPLLEETSVGAGEQLSLFSHSGGKNIGLLDVSSAVDMSIFRAIESFQPEYIFDIRPVPNFNIGRLTRRAAFALLDKVKTSYHDIGSILSPRKLEALHKNAPEVIGIINSVLQVSSSSADRQIIVIVSQNSHLGLLASALPRHLTLGPKRGWKIRNL